MILGIFIAMLFLSECCLFLLHRRKGSNLHNFFAKLHRPIGLLLIAIIILHLVFSLQLTKQRPIEIYISGILLMICAIAQAITYYCRTKLKQWLKIHKIIAVVMVILLCSHIYFGISSFFSYQQKISDINIADDIDISSIPDGTYIGEYDAGYIYAKVAVYIKNGTIKDIDILEHNNERGAPAEEIITDIVDKNNLKVDAVSGATNSSNVIKKAIENSLNGDNIHE